MKKNNLKQLRSSKGITQQEISNRTGYTQGQISRWENGHPLALGSAVRIAEALAVSVDELVTVKE